MQVQFGRINKRINDLSQPEFSGESWVADCELRGGVSMLSPAFILIINDDIHPKYFDFNYCYVSKWNRYYFIRDVIFDGNRAFIDCDEDVLASFYQEIRMSTFYCMRSFSDYDETLSDGMFPAKTDVKYFAYTFGNPWKDVKEGNYVIAICNGGVNGEEISHIGVNSYYVLSDTEITGFISDLMNKADLSFSGIADSIVKAMVDPMQYIRSCYWFPFELDCHTQSVSEISFGWWSSNVSAKVIDLQGSADTYTKFTVSIPFNEDMFEDAKREYLKYPPYSHYYLTCYPFGRLEISDDIITSYLKGNDIDLEISVDHLTGLAEFVIRCGHVMPRLVMTTQVGIEIPVGEVLQDFMGTVLNGMGAVGSSSSLNMAAVSRDIYNMFDCASPSVTVEGTCGGFTQLMLTDSWTFARYYREVNIDSELLGEPCCKNVVVANLNGYAEFSNVSMNGEMLEQEIEQIKQLLESGIFIE